MSQTKLMGSYAFVLCGLLDVNYECKLHGPAIGKGAAFLSVYKNGEMLKKWMMEGGYTHKNLKRAMRTAALMYYWEYPGKTLNNGRDEYEAFKALVSLYDSMTDESLETWLADNKYEYEFDVEATLSNREEPVPMVATAVCDGHWFRITLRMQLSNDKKHQRDDLVLTRDYSSAVTSTLPELVRQIGEDSVDIINAVLKINPKSPPAPYDGIANHVFGYRKREQ